MEHSNLYPSGVLGPTKAPETSLEFQAWRVLSEVNDPEIRRPITELGMVAAVEQDDTLISVTIRLTIAGCPMKDTIRTDVTKALESLAEGQVEVVLTTMTDAQRSVLRKNLVGARPINPFGKNSLTKVYAIASGKGGVGKSTIATNLAVGLAKNGLAVGLIDADIHGFSVPKLLGVSNKPTRIQDMIIPPVVHGVKVMSIGLLLKTSQPVVWRGPMLHKALEQFIAETYWGDLDILLIDLPPGTGDTSISISKLLPEAQILVVTTPESTASEVAARAGQMSTQTKQKVLGVIENMGPMHLPDGTLIEVFGAGGGTAVSEVLHDSLGYAVPVLASISLDPTLRSDSEKGRPSIIQSPNSPAVRDLDALVSRLMVDPRGLSGRRLPVTPTRS